MYDTFQILWRRAADYSATADMVPNPTSAHGHTFDSDGVAGAHLGSQSLLELSGHFAAGGWRVISVTLLGSNGPLSSVRDKAYGSVLLDDFRRGGTAAMETTLFGELRGVYLHSVSVSKTVRSWTGSHQLTTRITRFGGITTNAEDVVRPLILSFKVIGFSFSKPVPPRWWQLGRQKLTAS